MNSSLRRNVAVLKHNLLSQAGRIAFSALSTAESAGSVCCRWHAARSRPEGETGETYFLATFDSPSTGSQSDFG